MKYKPIYRYEDLPESGQETTIYQDQEKRFLAMPDVTYLKEQFSLKLG